MNVNFTSGKIAVGVEFFDPKGYSSLLMALLAQCRYTPNYYLLEHKKPTGE